MINMYLTRRCTGILLCCSPQNPVSLIVRRNIKKAMSSENIYNKIGSFLQTFNEIEAQTYVLLRMMDQDILTKHGQTIDQFKNRVRFV